MLFGKFGKLIKIRCIQTCSKSTTTRRYVWRVLHVDKDGGVNSSAERSCPEINAFCRGKVREDALGSNHRPGTLTALVVDAKKEVPHPCVLRSHVSGGIGYSVFYGNTSLKDVGVESGSVHEHTKKIAIMVERISIGRPRARGLRRGGGAHTRWFSAVSRAWHSASAQREAWITAQMKSN